MKILCVIDSLGSGGAQRQLVNLAISFKEQGHNVCFLVYHSNSFYYKDLYEQDIEIIEIIDPSYMRRIFRMRRAIRNGNYDSVLSFLEVPNLICEIASFPNKRFRLVVGERSANPKIHTSLKLRAYRIFHLLSDAVVANSYENIKMVRKVNPLLSKSKCHVIYNVVDFNRWSPKSGSYNFRADGKLNLIIAARHHYLKNLNILVEAINLLDKGQIFKISVKWYGRSDNDDSYLKALEKIKKYNLESVFQFFPATIDINDKVNSSDVVGLFSFYEGLPNTVCEAMVNSKVVIASDVSDINKFLNSDFIFSPKNEIELSLILKKLLTMREEEFTLIGKLNRIYALSVFDKNIITKKYLDLLS